MSGIDRLRAALAATGPPPDARELSEMLWLACHLAPAEEEPSPAPPAAPPVTAEPPAEPPAPPPPAAPSPPPAPEPLTGLHPRPGPGAEPAGSAAEVLVPTAPMLADALGVQRALRPLKRRVPSRHRRELDEEATAARIADTRLWAPVLVPSSERWLTLGLVVDTGPTMRLWQPLARELTETLIRQGAFQNVHVSYLDKNGRVASSPGAPPQDPATLLDASGRHAVLVLSDCSGPHWWSGHAARAVRRWAQAGPTAILQPLAERLWRRTAAPAVPGLAVVPRPGAPNTDLRFTPHDGATPPGVPVPVLEAAPRWFAAWARLVAGSGPQPAAVAALPARPSGAAPVSRERELPIGERVRRFLTTASPDAAELAAHVAVSDPSLPVMRLIQHRILGGSGPGRLAEVLLSGLLRPAGGVRYEFVPGAREALLDTLPRPEALHTRRVLEAVSAEIERRAGTAAETFRALLPADGGPVTLTADTDHFALVTPETRTHLAPGPAPAPAPARAPDLLELFGASPDELIARFWHGPSRKTLIGAIGDGGWFSLDLLSGRPDLPHGLIIGPRPARDALLRTIVFSLTLTHAPELVNLAFGNVSQASAFAELVELPHTSSALPDSANASLPQILGTERRRRQALLRAAGVATWDEYQTGLARGRTLDPLPALVVVIDDAADLVDSGPDLVGSLTSLCREGADQGIRFIFCLPDDARLPVWAAELTTWQADARDHEMSMRLPTGGQFRQEFRPAHVSPDAAFSILEAIRRRAPQVDPLPGSLDPAEPPAPEAAPRFDVLRLNGGGPSGMFHETWALPASEPRSPSIGYDDGGEVVTLHPLDISAGFPHGLIVGDTEARRRVLRAIAFALAAAYSPSDLTFAFAGLGEHPLGEPLDLPHVRYSEEELLGSPDRLRRFTGFLAAEIEARASGVAADPPGLVVFADVSLTFPSSRPEAAEALLTAAQKGAALGVQLLVGSSTVEDTTVWDRFLPLLGWRVMASEQPPAVLRRVLGRPSLPFTGERTAYLRAGTAAPRRFTVADEPPPPAVEDFVRRTRERVPPPAEARTSRNRAGEAEPPAAQEPGESIKALLGGALGGGHLVFCGPYGPEKLAAAEWCGEQLAARHGLPHGRVTTTSWRLLVGQDSGDRDTPGSWLAHEPVGGVLLVRDADALVSAENGPTSEAVLKEIVNLAVRDDDPLIILCGRVPAMRAVLTLLPPATADRFSMIAPAEWGGHVSPLPEYLPRGELAMASHGRIPIGVEYGTEAPAVLDFREVPHFTVVGPPGSGKTNVLYLVFDALSAGGEEPYVIDPSGGLNDMDFRLPGRPRISSGEYAATSSQVRSLIDRLLGRLERSPAEEFYLLVDDQGLLDRGLFQPLGPHLGGGRLHLVVARTERRRSGGLDSLLDELHPQVCAALLMGGPTPAERVPGRGVLSQGYESRFVQVASVL